MAKSRMVEARRAAKLTFAHRRAEKRAAERVRKAAEREARKASEKAARAAERAALKAAKEPVRRPGRPPKPRPRAARWTDYEPGHARKVYHAIKDGAVHTDTRSVAAFLGQHWIPSTTGVIVIRHSIER